MLSNKTYRFIFVILTLREGKRFVSFVPTEVNRSNERQEHLRNLVLFYIGAPQQAKRAVESTEKKGNVRLVNNLLLCCLPASQRLSSKYHAHWWLHYLKHSPSFECAMCRSHNVFRYVLRKLSLLSCALLRRIFSWSSRHWLLTWQNDLKNILAMNIVIKFVNIYIYIA